MHRRPRASHCLPGACRCPGAGGCGRPAGGRSPSAPEPARAASGPEPQRAGAVQGAQRTQPAGPAGDPAAAAAAAAAAAGAGAEAGSTGTPSGHRFCLSHTDPQPSGLRETESLLPHNRSTKGTSTVSYFRKPS
ncbi:uncharacterized protein LOC117718526 isoform X3 [Arvicanthis niloticus]|uniref:uncharacterized protein LOC117718526 isoform X3 n=1 Tax=Arvicanthis niloticus TaxID=61156 RepID=UPI001486BB7B|nr:dynein assembly factor 3, axonemal homolog isoform X2 [Arvicanthis niloticus]